LSEFPNQVWTGPILCTAGSEVVAFHQTAERSKMADNVAEGIENIKLEGDKNVRISA